MSENTATVKATETTETETVKPAPNADLENVALPTDLPEDDATALSMLEKLYGIFNKVTNRVREHRAHDKGDDVVNALLNDPEQYSQHPDLAEAIEKLSRAKEAVKKFTELTNTLAASIVAENSEDDFDVDKSRQDIQALRKEGTDLYKTVLAVFEFSDKVTIVKDDSGKVEDVVSEGAWGDALEKVSKFPNVRGTRGAAPAGNSETAKIREWANENGFTVSSRGRIQADVIAAYEAAHAE